MSAPAYLVRGEDPTLRAGALDELLAELVADEERGLAVEDLELPVGSGEADREARADLVARALNAAASPPFVTTCRVVVLRNAGALDAEGAAPVIRYLDAPSETSVLVLVAGGGTIPQALTKTLAAAGAVERAPRSEKTRAVLADAARAAGLRLGADAASLLAQHLGDDAGRVGSIVEMLHAAYGDDFTLGVSEVEPYLGDLGSVPSYALTDAIEAGDEAGALVALHRLLRAPTPRDPDGMQPLQVLGMLTSSYRRALRLDDPAVRTVADAVEALGGRVKQFPTRKALDQARALGRDGLRRVFDLLHQADLDLKGARGIPSDTVMEVLVVRLARLMRAAGATPRRRSRVS